MKDFKFKVLFKNGIEKEIIVNEAEQDIVDLVCSIHDAYQNNVSGVFVLGFAYIRISETVCIEVEK